MAFTETVYVGKNRIRDNNRTNTGSGAIANVPEGTGILIFGSDGVTQRMCLGAWERKGPLLAHRELDGRA